MLSGFSSLLDLWVYPLMDDWLRSTGFVVWKWRSVMFCLVEWRQIYPEFVCFFQRSLFQWSSNSFTQRRLCWSNTDCNWQGKQIDNWADIGLLEISLSLNCDDFSTKRKRSVVLLNTCSNKLPLITWLIFNCYEQIANRIYKMHWTFLFGLFYCTIVEYCVVSDIPMCTN